MLLKAKELAALIRQSQTNDPLSLSVVPTPNLDALGSSGTASIDLRLGRWFRTMRQSRTALIKIVDPDTDDDKNPIKLTKEYFVRFGDRFVLHPNKFVLGATLEWIRLPPTLAAYITGKSSLGRRGLIIETAAGIHPGFTGCLTLEITNVGEVPVSLVPGMPICQVFFHEVADPMARAASRFIGRRKAVLGAAEVDEVVQKLKEAT